MELISVQINGELKQVPPDNIAVLLQNLELQNPSLALAINNQVIPSAEYSTTRLKPGDCIEIIQAVCGG